MMQVWQLVAISVAILVLAGVGWWLYERNRTQHLRSRFGSEYDRRVATIGDRRRAESELALSEQRVKKLTVRPLSASDRIRFQDEWRMCQARFVDDPSGAVDDADRILNDIMRVRGLSVDNPDDRMVDVVAAYPHQASAFRDSHDILIRHHRGIATTEDLRKAFVNYRSLFDDMLGGQDEELRRAS
jgi:hypothetical protein